MKKINEQICYFEYDLKNVSKIYLKTVIRRYVKFFSSIPCNKFLSNAKDIDTITQIITYNNKEYYYMSYDKLLSILNVCHVLFNKIKEKNHNEEIFKIV